MATVTPTTYAADLQEYFSKKILSTSWNGRRYNQTLPPITYTSMRAWLFMNYLLLVLLTTLPPLAIYFLLRMFAIVP